MTIFTMLAFALALCLAGVMCVGALWLALALPLRLIFPQVWRDAATVGAIGTFCAVAAAFVAAPEPTTAFFAAAIKIVWGG